jgi:hypothetical protein
MNQEPKAWYARRWIRALCGVVGVGLLLFAVTGPLTLTFLSVTSLGCLPGTSCERWATVTLPLGAICTLLALSSGLIGCVQALRPRRGLVIAQIALALATGVAMVALVIAAQEASVGRVQVAAAQQAADEVVVAGDAALRQALGFHPIWDSDPQGRVTGTGPDQQFLGCLVASGQELGYQVQIEYGLGGLDDGQQGLLASIDSVALPGGGQAAVSIIDKSDSGWTWQVVSPCMEVPKG